MQFKPLNHYIAISPIKAEEKQGSIILVNAGNNQYQFAKVTAVADDVDGLAVGDTILYDTLGAVTHRIGNRGLTTVLARNVLGVISDLEVV